MDKLVDCVMSIASKLLLPYVTEVATKAINTIKDVPKDVSDMKDKLDGIQAIIHEADKIAADEEDNTVREEIKAKMEQMIETSFRMEDIMDEYTIREQHDDDPGWAALPSKAVDFAKAMTSRLQFSCMNEDVKSEFRRIKKMSSSSGGSQNARLLNLQEAPLYIKEADVVGFDVPRRKLIDWSVDENRKELSVMCVVAQGGQGKTTLVKKVFDSKEVVEKFSRHVWITVSQSYTIEALLRDMLQKLYEETKESLPEKIDEMGRRSLIDEVRKRLCNKRYVVVFDDIWNPNFWDEMEFALIDNDNGSRIFITTRNMGVAVHFKRSVSVQLHELPKLDNDMSLALFHKKAFRSYDDCPDNLKDVSIEIVEKCEGLPLAIVAIGGLLSRKDRDPLEWQRFSQNLSLQLGKDPDLTVVTKILALSYHDLPYYLKQCFLYFGIFPEDYEVKCARLIRQWIAEGFVHSEEIANQYLTEFINRSLVQPSSFTIVGKPKGCRVHDLVRDMIIKKVVDLSFCHFVSEHETQSISGMIRHLSITSASNNLSESVESSNIRSLHFFVYEFPMSSILIKNRQLKVLDFEDFPLFDTVPGILGDFFLLRYLSLRNTFAKYLPNSIGMLHNLETLDLRNTRVRLIPREINQLKKLRHLLAYTTETAGIQMGHGIGDLASLETLCEVDIADVDGEELIKELERVTHLRVLGLTNVRQEYGSALCFLIKKMKHLEKLHVRATGFGVIDLHHLSAPVLRKLFLIGILNVLPNWIAGLKHLVKLSLEFSYLTHDPLASLQHLPSLLCLRLLTRSYDGQCLHFPDGGFENLEQLVLKSLYNLNSILIDGGALSHLKKFTLEYNPGLVEVPFGVYSLPMLEVVHSKYMPRQFEQSIDRNRGKHQWIIS